MQTGELVWQIHTWEISDLGILTQNSSTPENLWPDVSLHPPALQKNPSIFLPFALFSLSFFLSPPKTIISLGLYHEALLFQKSFIIAKEGTEPA